MNQTMPSTLTSDDRNRTGPPAQHWTKGCKTKFDTLLRFISIGSEKDNDYFESRMSDALITRLSKINAMTCRAASRCAVILSTDPYNQVLPSIRYWTNGLQDSCSCRLISGSKRSLIEQTGSAEDVGGMSAANRERLLAASALH